MEIIFREGWRRICQSKLSESIRNRGAVELTIECDCILKPLDGSIWDSIWLAQDCDRVAVRYVHIVRLVFRCAEVRDCYKT